MKYLILILIIGFNFVHFKLAAQCKTGDVHISTETKLNEFKSNFSACDTIFGILVIGPEILGGKTRLIEINGLENIKVILGNLEITRLKMLQKIFPMLLNEEKLKLNLNTHDENTMIQYTLYF